MKKDFFERLETEVKACKKYAEKAVERAKEGKIGTAINLLDIAEMARKCAEQAHENLWKVSKGELTEEEFEVFCEAETLGRVVKKAFDEVQDLRK